MLPWLPFLTVVAPAQRLKAWCVTVKVLADISALSGITLDWPPESEAASGKAGQEVTVVLKIGGAA